MVVITENQMRALVQADATSALAAKMLPHWHSKNRQPVQTLLIHFCGFDNFQDSAIGLATTV